MILFAGWEWFVFLFLLGTYLVYLVVYEWVLWRATQRWWREHVRRSQDRRAPIDGPADFTRTRRPRPNVRVSR